VEVRFLDGHGVRRCDPDDVVELFSHDDGFYWIDIPVWDAEAESLLAGLGCHSLVIEGCQQRNYIPTVHGYEDHVFVTTQSPYLGRAGHVHLLELDQIIGHHFLVTVHGPINPGSTSRSRWSRRRACWPASRAAGSTRRHPPSCRTPSPRPSLAGSGRRSARSR
jgi:Mg2+ and Co2+ transporter CorA